MMALGAFRFSLDTAAYQRLERETSYRWPQSERFGKLPLLQSTGPSSDSITLEGIIYPGFKGSATQLDLLRTQAGLGTKLTLVTGRGVYLGLWSVLSVREGQEYFFSDGVPRKLDFTVQLVQADDLTVKIAGFPVSVGGLMGLLV